MQRRIFGNISERIPFQKRADRICAEFRVKFKTPHYSH